MLGVIGRTPDWLLEFSFRCILLLYYINMKPGVKSRALWNVPVIKGRVLRDIRNTVSLWVCMNYKHMLLGHTPITICTSQCSPDTSVDAE